MGLGKIIDSSDGIINTSIIRFSTFGQPYPFTVQKKVVFGR